MRMLGGFSLEKVEEIKARGRANAGLVLQNVIQNSKAREEYRERGAIVLWASLVVVASHLHNHLLLTNSDENAFLMAVMMDVKDELKFLKQNGTFVPAKTYNPDIENDGIPIL